uniref:Ras and Rab interactor 2-like n=1 Tax=Phallusia mammillata TaxID=59560 RepID=A0A6F9DRJ6_9ASCI|nr:ras and Rab interactor 2-like [Phallusia mammillata]
MSRTKEYLLISNLFYFPWSKKRIKRCINKAPALVVCFFLLPTLLSAVQATTSLRRHSSYFPHISYDRQVSSMRDVNVDQSKNRFVRGTVLLNSIRRMSKTRTKRQTLEDIPDFEFLEFDEGLPGARFSNAFLHDPNPTTVSLIYNTNIPPTAPPFYRNLSNTDLLSMFFGNNTNFPYERLQPPETEASGDFGEDVFNPPIDEGEIDTSRQNHGNNDSVAASTISWQDYFYDQFRTSPSTTVNASTSQPLTASPMAMSSATTIPDSVTTKKAVVTLPDISTPLTSSVDNLTSKETIATTSEAEQITVTKDFISTSMLVKTSTEDNSETTYVDADFGPTGSRHHKKKWRTIVIAVLVPALVIAIVTVLALTWVYVLSARWKRHRRIDVEAQPVTNGHSHERPPGSGSSDTSSMHVPKRNGLTNHNEAWSENGHSVSPR